MLNRAFGRGFCLWKVNCAVATGTIQKNVSPTMAMKTANETCGFFESAGKIFRVTCY